MFINGAPVVGARTVAAISPVIDAHLARSRAVVQGGVARGDLYALLMTGAEGDDRADPSRVPSPATLPVDGTAPPSGGADGRGHAPAVEPHSDDRVRAVAAACRRRDAARATELAGTLANEARRRAMLVCTGAGIDLPHP